MKPFHDKGKFRNDLPAPQTSSPSFVPRKVGTGTEIRYGRDLKKRNSIYFISSGKWAEMPDDGLIDQEISPAVIGELIDPLEITGFTDVDERSDASTVLSSGEIIKGKTIDYEGEANKDGRITVFSMRSRSYVSNEEIPVSARGIKVEKYGISGVSNAVSSISFLDGGESPLGITREGFYGIKEEIVDPYVEEIAQDGLGFAIDEGDFSQNDVNGSHGFSLYSSEYGTDSIAFAGMKK